MATKERTKRRPRERTPRQEFLPAEGMPTNIPALNKAARDYMDFRDTRIEALNEEVKAKEKLMAAMKEHGLQVYEFDNHVVLLNSVDGVKVKKKKVQESNGDGEE